MRLSEEQNTYKRYSLEAYSLKVKVSFVSEGTKQDTRSRG